MRGLERVVCVGYGAAARAREQEYEHTLALGEDLAHLKRNEASERHLLGHQSVPDLFHDVAALRSGHLRFDRPERVGENVLQDIVVIVVVLVIDEL